MTAAELIAELSKYPPDIPVVHCIGTMQDRETVSYLEPGVPGKVMWTAEYRIDKSGNWVELV